MFVLQNLYTLILVLNIGLAITIIFLERKNIGVTWAWLMVLLFLPVVGFLLYFTLGQNLSKRKLYRMNDRSKSMLTALIESQRREFKLRQIQLYDPFIAQYRDMIYMNLTSSSAFYTQNNEVEIFTNGHQKFESLLQTIEEAKEHVHLLYYIMQDDNLGKRLIETLAKKANEGVEVRLLYDGIGSYKLNPDSLRPLIEAGGHAAVFFPSKIPYFNIRVNYRNHRKLAIIDGRYGYIGGFNVGDEYLGLDDRFGYWRDTHLLLKGHAVLQMQVQFLLDWSLASSEQLVWDSRLFPVDDAGGKVGVQIVSSGPDEPIEHIRNAYIKMIYAAKESIYIQTPYFIPDESVLTALKMAALSGVDVRLILPGKPDHKMVYWASFSYLGDLLSVGMKCYLYEKGFLHAKTIVVDGKVASVGTANVDIRSFKLNFEVNAVLYHTETASRLKVIFEEDMGCSRELTYEAYQARPKLHRIRESCTRLLSPIL